jgi:hypothetical protein
MNLTSITLTNFKGISTPTTIPFKPITLLFGANSAGKSTILQSLIYLRELLERANSDPRETLLGGAKTDLGGFRSLINNHDSSKVMRIEVEMSLDDDGLPYFRDDSVFPGRHPLEEICGQVQHIGIAFEVGIRSHTSKPDILKYETFINHDSIGKIGLDQNKVTKSSPPQRLFDK